MDLVRVIKPGLQTTVQDLGRWGWQSRGVAVAGPMDPFSHRAANALVGNPVDAATLEVAVIGPELEFECERLVVVSGAEFELTIDGTPVMNDVVVKVVRGSRLLFGRRRWGTRTYVAIGGGITTPPVFGSRATHVPGRIGGLNGRALAAGDVMPIGQSPARRAAAGDGSPRVRSGVSHLAGDRFERVGAQASGRVRMLPGPQAGWFGEHAIDLLESSPFVITTDSNRMGYRLQGPALDHEARVLISEATPIGTVQVPPSGQPILLMADRQTSGGYPKIATVIAADIGIAGQLGPGDTVAFEATTWHEAAVARDHMERALAGLEGSR